MEYFDIVDAAGTPTGQIVSRDEAHQRGIPHRTAHVWVIRRTDGRTQVLLQKRADEKDSFPGCWDTSSAGHIPAGSDIKPSAVRELKEELGIEANENQLKEAGMFRIRFTETFHNQIFDDNEIAFVFVYEEPVDLSELTLQKEEVSDAKWFDLDMLVQRLKEKDPAFCVDPGGVACLKAYLKGMPHE